MNKQKWLVLAAMILALAVTAGVLNWLRTHQKLGVPGIRAEPVPGSVVMKIELPESVLDFTSERVPQSKMVLDMLPKDTSFAQRLYTSADGRFQVNASIVLMGADRTSIHKPEYCLPGQGWSVREKSVVSIPIAGSARYEMRVAKWVIGNSSATREGLSAASGLYVFWFVADKEQTVSHWQRIWWLARDLLRTGVLQRWAYVSYITLCEPGKEDAAFERVKQLIAASVPEFQLPPETATVGVRR